MTAVGPQKENISTKRNVHKLRLSKQNEVDEDSSMVKEQCKFTDSTGTDLEQFIISTLHKNAKDRQLLLETERELVAFIRDASKRSHRFAPMTSYNRMIVHRVAAFFGLHHNVDQLGTAVVDLQCNVVFCRTVSALFFFKLQTGEAIFRIHKRGAVHARAEASHCTEKRAVSFLVRIEFLLSSSQCKLAGLSRASLQVNIVASSFPFSAYQQRRNCARRSLKICITVAPAATWKKPLLKTEKGLTQSINSNYHCLQVPRKSYVSIFMSIIGCFIKVYAHSS
ncbi:R3H domain containing protein [Trichuris trichiura]|uniref:R3H domain containing protein n=1 Tax=Trichuris trichiura TaxID=36087 RepID=A0A077YVZ1_TRITR|nr:R3H domain containing protein [Trichuris trichiura]